MLRVQDIAVLKIVEWNDWQRPIFFSVAVPVENQVGLTPYLSLNGLAYRLVREREPGLDQQEMERNFYRVFQWRNLLGREMTSDPGVAPLLFNYQAAVMQLADFYRRKGMDEALAQLLAWASQRIPFVWHAHYSASTYLAQMGQHQLAFEYAERAVQKRLDTYRVSGDATYDDLIDLMDELTKKYRDSAWSAQFYRQIIEVEPSRWEAYHRLASSWGWKAITAAACRWWTSTSAATGKCARWCACGRTCGRLCTKGAIRLSDDTSGQWDPVVYLTSK